MPAGGHSGGDAGPGNGGGRVRRSIAQLCDEAAFRRMKFAAEIERMDRCEHGIFAVHDVFHSSRASRTRLTAASTTPSHLLTSSPILSISRQAFSIRR